MPFRYLVFFRLSACGYGTVERQYRGEKKKKKCIAKKRKDEITLGKKTK